MGKARWSTEGSEMEKIPRNSRKDGNSYIRAQKVTRAADTLHGDPRVGPSGWLHGGGGAAMPGLLPTAPLAQNAPTEHMSKQEDTRTR